MADYGIELLSRDSVTEPVLPCAGKDDRRFTAMPCNLQKIVLEVRVADGADNLLARQQVRSIVVSNAQPNISAPHGRSGLEEADESAVREHAVYVHLRLPFTAAAGEAAAPAPEERTKSEIAKRTIAAVASVTMAERCEQHALCTISGGKNPPPPSRRDSSGTVMLEIERAGLDLDMARSVVKSLASGRFDNPFAPSDARTISFESCALPTSGKPRERLTAFISLGSLDKWKLQYSLLEGITLAVSTSHTASLTGFETSKASSSYEDNFHGVAEERAYSEKSANTAWTNAREIGGRVKQSTEDMETSGTFGAAASDARIGRLHAATREMWSKAAVKERVKEERSKADVAKKIGNALSFELNGAKFEGAKIIKSVTDVIEWLKRLLADTITVVNLLVECGQAFSPYKYEIGSDIEIKLLSGSFNIERALEPRSAAHTGQYYITNAEPDLALSFEFLLLKIDIAFSIGILVCALLKAIASAGIKIETRFEIEAAKISGAWRWGAPEMEVEASNVGLATLSVTAEGNVGNLYARAKGAITGGIRLTAQWRIGMEGIRRVKGEYQSDALTGCLTFYKGKARVAVTADLEHAVMGDGEPCYRLPSSGVYTFLPDRAWHGEL